MNITFPLCYALCVCVWGGGNVVKLNILTLNNASVTVSPKIKIKIKINNNLKHY